MTRNRFFLVITVVAALTAVLSGGCASHPSPEPEPAGPISAGELLADPVYDSEVTIYGTVGLLGELLCPCFELNSGGQSLQVWYGLMVENDGTERPTVDVSGIGNGDTVIVTGELKGAGGTHYSQGDFWLTGIVNPAPELEIRPAPIHEVRINIAESYPPQVIVYIQGGLSDGCTTFHELNTQRSGRTIDIEVTTQRPIKSPICPDIYGLFEQNVNLGSDFTSGETYTVTVNDVTTDFVMS